MKPVLLNNIKDYPKSGLGRITTATNQQVHEVYNGDYTFSFDMLVTDKLFKKVKEEMIIATFVSKQDTDFFYVKTTDVKSPGVVTVNCSHVTMLTNENYVRGKLSIDGKSVKAILSEMSGMLDLPGQSFTYSTSLNDTVNNTKVVYENNNPGQIMIGDANSLTNILDARLVRKGMNLELSSKNTGHYMDLRKGKNISGVNISKSIENLTTSIVPYYKFKVDHSDNAGNNWGYTIEEVSNGLAKVGSFDIPVYDDEGKKTSGGLTAGSNWKVSKRRTKNNDIQYCVGINMWVDSSDVTFSGTVGKVTSRPPSPTYSNIWTVKKVTNGIVTVTSDKANVFNDAGNATGKTLSGAYVTDKRRTLMGSTQYRVATNEWVSASDVSFKGTVGDVIPNRVSATNTDGWTIKRINPGGKVTAARTAIIYDDSNTANTTRMIGEGSPWATDQIRSKSGVSQYRVATNMWVNAGDMTFSGTVGSIISEPAPVVAPEINWSYFKVSNGTVTATTSAAVYNDDNQNGSGRRVGSGSAWKTDMKRTRGNTTQYRIGPDMWLDSGSVTLQGSVADTGAQTNYSINSDGWTIKEVSKGVFTVGSNPITVKTDDNQNVVGRGLAKNSKWSVDQVRTKSGLTQYRVATNMWVDSTDGSFSGSTGQIISIPATSTTVDKDGWKVIEVKNGTVTVGNMPAELYDDNNVMVNNRRLDPLSVWVVDRQRNRDGIYQFRVATNMWVLSNAVAFKGSLGKILSGATETGASTTDDADDEQIQYGPEVNSLLKDNYAMPHRKYVDYSSRVDNLMDLIDVSSKYFIENPKVDEPTYTITVDVLNASQKRVQEAHIGDIARIYDTDYNLATDQTIVERYFDPDLMMNKTVKAGSIQQTIFRYLDKRIKEEAKKAKASVDKTGVDIVDATNSVLNDVSDTSEEIKSNYDVIENAVDDKLDEAEKKAQEQIQKVNDDVVNTRTQMTNFMNSGGNNKIRWIPSLAEATQMEITTPYGYWLLDDHGAGFHSNDGTVMTGLSADGRVYADSITGNKLTGTTINGGTITGGVINGAQLTGVSIEGAQSIRLNNNGNVTTSIANYGISTPAITVRQIDGANLIQTNQLTVSNIGTIKYLHIASGGNISCDGGGLYLQGPVYVDGRKI